MPHARLDRRIWVAGGLACLFALASIAAFTAVVRHSHATDGGLQENALWGAYQLDREAVRLSASLAGPPSAVRGGEIAQRYDILASRAGLLESGRFAREFAEGSRFHADAHALTRRIKALERDFDALGDEFGADGPRIARLQAAVAALLPATSQLLGDANLRSGELREAGLRAASSLHALLAGALAGMALAAAAVIGLLARQLRLLLERPAPRAADPSPPVLEVPLPPAPAGAAAVFDAQFYRELFTPGEAEGEEWLLAFQTMAEDIAVQLGHLLPPHAAAPIAGPAVAALAHRLVGASLSVGATRLGEQARRVEHAAMAADREAARAAYVVLLQEMAAARAAIAAFAASLRGKLPVRTG